MGRASPCLFLHEIFTDSKWGKGQFGVDEVGTEMDIFLGLDSF